MVKMTNVAPRFCDLEIDGALVTELLIESYTKLSLNLLMEPVNLMSKEAMKRNDLIFFRLFHFRTDLQFIEYPRVTSHVCFDDSELLNEYRNHLKKAPPALKDIALYHFKLQCAEGSLEFIAEDFCIAQTQNIIPFPEA